MMWRRRTLVIGLVFATVGCSADPVPTLPSPTPIPNEPCDAETLEPALARLNESAEYRFKSIVEVQELRRPTNLNNPAFIWVAERSVGSFLAPDRARVEIVGGDPEGGRLGYDAKIDTGGRTWILVPEVGQPPTWREIDPNLFETNPASAINVIIGDRRLPFEAVEDVAGLPSKGGCVFLAGVGGDQPAEISVRLDPLLGRVVSWRSERGSPGPADGSGIRQSFEIVYEQPSADEFQPPPSFEPLPAS